MSADEIQKIIRRSVIDRAFAKALRDNFTEALSEYNLSPIEMSALRAMQIEFDVRKGTRRRSKRHTKQHVKRKSRKSSSSNSFYQLD